MIARVHVSSGQVGYRGIVPDEVPDAMSLERREERWRQILQGEEKSGFTVVAEVEGHGAQGFSSGLFRSRDEDARERSGEVTALYVEPSWWHRDLGRRLLAEVLDRLRSEGAPGGLARGPRRAARSDFGQACIPAMTEQAPWAHRSHGRVCLRAWER